MGRGKEEWELEKMCWLTFVDGADAGMVRRVFRKRFGEEPKVVLRRRGLVYAGPVGDDEAGPGLAGAA